MEYLQVLFCKEEKLISCSDRGVTNGLTHLMSGLAAANTSL